MNLHFHMLSIFASRPSQNPKIPFFLILFLATPFHPHHHPHPIKNKNNIKPTKNHSFMVLSVTAQALAAIVAVVPQLGIE